MGYVRLRIRELAKQKGWTLKQVADQSGVNYNTVRSYVQREALNTADISAVYKIARAFDVTMEDLVEILEDWGLISIRVISEWLNHRGHRGHREREERDA